MEERPISSRMQELLQRAADERQLEQDRQGETVESLRARVDELSTSVVAGNERLTEKIDATFALTASTVEILQRLADRVDSLERSLDDITMRLGSISWRIDEVRDGEGRLAERIDESALALAEAMFAAGHGRRPDTSWRDVAGATELAPSEPRSNEPAPADAEETRHDEFRREVEPDERQLPSFAATAARFEPPSLAPSAAPAAGPDRPETAEPLAESTPESTPSPPESTPSPPESTPPTESVQPPRPDTEDRPYANVVDLPSSGRRSAGAEQPADDVAGGRPLWGPSGDFLGSRPPAAAAGSPATAAFEFPAETGEPSATARADDDEEQDFFDRWAPRSDDMVVAEQAPQVPSGEPPVREPEGSGTTRRLGGAQTGSRFLREVSAARETHDPTRPVEAVAATDARGSDDTMPPEWFASYFRNDARSAGPGSRPAPGSA